MPITNIQQAMAAMGAPYSKTEPQLKSLYLRHLQEWRPKQYKTLVEDERQYLVAAQQAKKAFNEIQKMVENGYQNHEAEEVVLPRYILLKPEPEVIEAMEAE